jgi:DHA2 family multidrug resistance protein-like MFS transporter
LTTQAASPDDGLPYPRRRWAMATVGLAIFMTVSDQTMVNVALPIMRDDLGVDASASVWVVNAYQLAIMLALLPLSSAGDILGFKRVYSVGLGLFTLASLGCALAPSLSLLIVMRVLQGLGAAGVMSVNMALVRYIHPINRLGYGIGLNALAIAVSAAIGPTIASAILAVAPWPWLFVVKVPIGAVAVVIGYLSLPETPRASHAFDAISAVLCAMAFSMLIAVIDTLSRPVPAAMLAGEIVLTLASGYVLAQRELRVPSPLLPVDLLRIPMFALSAAVSMTGFIAQTLSFIALPFHLQDLGYTAVETGLLMTPLPIGTAILAAFSGKLSDRYPAGLLGLVGLIGFAAGLASLALLSTQSAIADIVWRMALAGAGYGLYQSPNNRTMQASAPRSRSGGASGMQAMARLLGQTVGAGLTAFVFARAMQGGVPALWLACAFSLLGALISAVRLTDLPKI